MCAWRLLRSFGIALLGGFLVGVLTVRFLGWRRILTASCSAIILAEVHL